MPRFVVNLVLLILCASPALPQSFEAAIVKVGGPPPQTLKTMRGGPGTNDPDRFIYEHTTLANLMTRAYGVGVDQIQGPDWVKDFADDRAVYTVNAIIPLGTSEEQFRIMLQRLLTDRFHLTIHRSTKDFPGYDLTVAESGPKIKPCALEGEPSDPKQKTCTQLPRGATMTTSMSHGIGAWGAIRRTFIMTMAGFAENLGQAINESKGLESGLAVPRVTDRTGLIGTYEIELQYAGVIVLPGMPVPPMNDLDSAPALSAALEKQLGLKLVKTKDVPVEILVIDHADKTPAEN